MVTGVVTNETKEPLPGVNVVIKNTERGTVTDLNGFFKIMAPQDSILIFRFLGYKSVEEPIQNRIEINVSLEPDITTLSEVVIVGYGSQEIGKITGAATVLNVKDFNNGFIDTPETLFQGKIAGVDVFKFSGEPGAESFIRIRGANTIRASNRPLIVIDGYPMDIVNLDPPGTENQSVYSPLTFINPNDIESINILKDASAAAIYGSRASNGVILIKTKSGSATRSGLEYRMSMGISQIRKKIDVLSAGSFREEQQKLGLDSANVLPFNTDWQDEIFQTAWSQSHDIAYSGGDQKTNYRVSLGLMDQQGIIETSSLRRYSIRTNIRHQGIQDRLHLNFNLAYSSIKHRQTNGKEAYQALPANPTYPVVDADGNYFGVEQNYPYNAVANLHLNDNRVFTDKIISNLISSFDISQNLSLNLNLGFEKALSDREVNKKSHDPTLREGFVGEHRSGSYLIEPYLEYIKQLSNAHYLQLLAGYSWQEFEIKQYGFGASNFDTQILKFTDDLEAGGQKITPTSLHEKSKLQSFYGRLNYSYKDKVLLTVNYRMDGSSRFGENNKYGHFPSAGLGWRLDQEPFLEGSPMSMFKLRASWGINGNQEFPNKLTGFLLGTSPADKALLDSSGVPVSGFNFTETPNPNLKWEETRQVDIGFDFGLWEDRFTGTIEYFHKKVTDLLYQVPVSSAPTPLMWTNLDGAIINKGIEFSLSGDVIHAGAFNWHTDLVFTRINNEIEGLPTDQPVGEINSRSIAGVAPQVLRNGEEIGSFYGPVFLGFNQDGSSMYKTDESGIRIEEIIGQALPDLTWGLTNSFSYKGFSLTVFINASQGIEVYDNKFNNYLIKGQFLSGDNITYSLLNNEESYTNNNVYSSRFIKEASFVRVNYLTIGYDFNIHHINWIRQLRVYFTGSNLKVWSSYDGFDPEVNTFRIDADNGIPTIGIDADAYPRARSFLFGLNITF